MPAKVRNSNMKTATIKLIAIALFAIPLLLLTMLKAAPVKGAVAPLDDPAADYKDKYKCAVCHTPTASKFYDPAKTDEEHVQTILKGKKGEKPPYMPAFETKGMTEAEARSLAAYMKGLKKAE
jgi:mono/diheme cytochrome c family protein